MRPDALIYSTDPSLVAAVSSAVRQRQWNSVCVDRAGAGLDLLRARKYAAIIIDCIDPATSSGLLELCRRSASNKTSVVFALAEQRDAAINRNANFVVKRSACRRDLAGILHTAEGIIRQEFRRYRRIPVEVLVVLENDEHRLQLTTTNVSQGGMCLAGELKGWNREHTVQFTPAYKSQFHANSSVVWMDCGKTGIQFQGMSAACRVLLEDWLKQHE